MKKHLKPWFCAISAIFFIQGSAFALPHSQTGEIKADALGASGPHSVITRPEEKPAPGEPRKEAALVPEPFSLALFGMALLGLAGIGRKTFGKKAPP